MSWAVQDHDDWLEDEKQQCDELSVQPAIPVPVEIEIGHSSKSEPLHTLPEAPISRIHVSETVKYFIVKLDSARNLGEVQNRNQVDIPQRMELQLNMAFAQSAFVVLIFSINSLDSFDGYSIMKEPAKYSSRRVDGRQMITVPIEFIRRATVSFQEVRHIRDDIGLLGRPITTARDGALLGTPAGRTLSRLIDKRAFRDDPFHYKDARHVGRIVSVDPKAEASTIPLTNDEKAFLSMEYGEYQAWFDANIGDVSRSVPSLSSIKFI